MAAFPDPQWPIVVLAVVQFVDALLCIKPAAFIADCFAAVHWPRRLWWLMPPIKFAASAGLVLGLWIPYLAALTCAALVVYFLCAIAAHVRARDLGRNLFLNATGMLALCVATGVYCFLL
ncbi:DoxX family protein [Mycolicibacterium sp. S2-37]|uniref:DoxX family protein n=1 Tax=Mycolicibacterium sp. S2-37 TaxID=2810297 RepID=UPI001A944130|nr:DoxX family protein [Mycolicibacterium sp. S2-37]MBO0678339.1 DoxX family protein [Mycolicibacterium sp. S2-37]